MNIKKMQIAPSPTGNTRIYIETDTPVHELSELYEKFQNGKEYKVDIKPVTKKRSNDQNALLWHYIGLISQSCYVDKDSVYHQILSRYGVYTPLQIISAALPEIQDLFGYVEVLEQREDGTLFVLGYKGISKMTSEEASRVIEGAKSEAESMGLYDDEWNSGY